MFELVYSMMNDEILKNVSKRYLSMCVLFYGNMWDFLIREA